MAAQTLVRNTTTGYTSALQFTETAGGTNVTFYTPQLQALQLDGIAKVYAGGLESNALANCCLCCEIASVLNDGSSPQVWGVGKTVELGTSESSHTFWVAGWYGMWVAAGKRLRIRFFIDDAEGSTGAMATGYTATLYYNGASGQQGDTYIHFNKTLNLYTPSDPPFHPPGLFTNHYITR